jgi:pimeloyl-ACP methyl ester carboxylesterase
MAPMLTAKSRDGTAIAYEKNGQGPSLVLVHGTGADHTRWAPIVPRLAERFTVCSMDRRGRGGSGDGPSYAFEREFEDVAAVVDAVDEPVFLLGHSHGAICSLEAMALTTKVRRAVLYEPPVPSSDLVLTPEVVAKLDRFQAAGDRQGILETFYREVVRMPAAELEMMKSLPAWRGRLAAAHTIPREERLYLQGSPDLYRLRPERFASLRVPTLLLEGGDSPKFLKTAVAAVHAALPQSRVVILPGQQHTAMNTAPDLFLREVLSFLKQE